MKAAVVLLLCVPLIPLSIVAVQKFAKKMLNRYWGTYTELGDSFLENLQGLTTLKIYQADDRYARKMDEEAEKFRKIDHEVLEGRGRAGTGFDCCESTKGGTYMKYTSKEGGAVICHM